MAEVYLVRHSESTWNAEGRIQGQSDEAALTPNGKTQANDLAESLRPLLENREVEIWSSDLQRAQQTAQIIKDVLNLESEIQLDPELREAKFGRFEGKTRDQYQEDPDYKYCKLNEYFHKLDPENGESYEEVANRVHAAMLRIIEQSEKKVIIIVTHGGAMRSLQMRTVPKGSPASAYNGIPNPKHHEIYRFDVETELVSKVTSERSPQLG